MKLNDFDIATIVEQSKHSINATFDQGSMQWSCSYKQLITNAFFLKVQQNYFNDRLNAQGHVFLNEVYDALGFKRTSLGALVGWLSGSYIDFGFDFVEVSKKESLSIELTFNVDGFIFDKI